MRKLKSLLIKSLVAVIALYILYSILNTKSTNNKEQRKHPTKHLKPIDNYVYDEHNKANLKQNDLNQINEPILNEPKLLNRLMVKKETNGKKDWHNYAQIAEDNQRQGAGEQGLGVVLSLEDANSNKKRDLFYQNGFNGLVSDKISLQRSIADIRHEKCKKRLYLENLPKVSIIIPFHDEHLSVLLRSVYSIVHRTPEELLEEIILVDDFSKKEFLKKDLEDHLAENFKKDLVKIIRNKKREGLIRTRMAGANIAKADILIFFDSHIECNVNWLPPLIEPIVLNYTTAVCPFIDVISDDSFAYTAQDNGARGAFDWELYYKRLPLLPQSNSDPSEPFESPVMAGGLFAISKKWFYTLGGYDEGLEIWGGEQYELSFKIWQCGGSMVDAPCSRIGHIYRKFNPFSAVGSGDYLSKNYKRVAEIWMDEFKEYIYKKKPYYRSIDAGDISKQLAIKEKLQCKPFKWFMENVAFDLVKYYPPIPPPNYAEGEIRSVASKLCIDSKFKSDQANFGLEMCQSSNRGVSGEQKFELTWHSDIRPKTRSQCFDVSKSDPGVPVVLFSCHGMKGNQEFKYNLKTLQIIHPISNQCLDSNTERKEIFMNPCDSKKDTQKWQFEKTNATLIKMDFKF